MPHVTALIAEYDPLHQGHFRHLSWLRGQTEVLLVVLGGVFSQRGEPALLHPLTRAHMALLAGADLVVALPAPFCFSQAGLFARGAVALAQALGADGISFGSECDDSDLLGRASFILAQETTAFKVKLREALAEGASFASAQAAALTACDPSFEGLLSQPNSALALAYLAEGLKRGWHPQVLPLHRPSGDHHGALSATALRCALRSGADPKSLALAPSSFAPLDEALAQGCFTPDVNALWPALHHQLLTAPPADIERLYGEGLGVKAQSLACELTGAPRGFESLIEGLTSKRHPRSRLRRASIALYLGLSLQDWRHAEARGPEEILLLGANGRGRAHLAKVKKESPLPLHSRPFAQRSKLAQKSEWLWESLTARPDATRLKKRKPILI